MKKLLYLLLLLPLGFLTSCHDDDDNVNVNLLVAFNNVAVTDQGALYAVQDTPITIEGVTCQGIGSKAVVTDVTYYWDNLVLFVPPFAPYGGTFDTAVQTPGKHLFGVNAQIAQEGKALGFAAIGKAINIVATADELPEGLELGQHTITFYGDTK